MWVFEGLALIDTPLDLVTLFTSVRENFSLPRFALVELFLFRPHFQARISVPGIECADISETLKIFAVHLDGSSKCDSIVK